MAYEILAKYHHRIPATLERPPSALWEDMTAGILLHQPRRPAEFLASLPDDLFLGEPALPASSVSW
ncbi:MAG: hypothetical protein RLO51_29065 [Thalassobaculum sp.]|uniref:hypothetical protein n=1 Tax=Thalassobaculum sp. TaxID=2022740 RepID=UPI0032EAD02A